MPTRPAPRREQTPLGNTGPSRSGLLTPRQSRDVRNARTTQNTQSTAPSNRTSPPGLSRRRRPSSATSPTLCASSIHHRTQCRANSARCAGTMRHRSVAPLRTRIRRRYVEAPAPDSHVSRARQGPRNPFQDRAAPQLTVPVLRQKQHATHRRQLLASSGCCRRLLASRSARPRPPNTARACNQRPCDVKGRVRPRSNRPVEDSACAAIGCTPRPTTLIL
jgi:hypothetical protein